MITLRECPYCFSHRIESMGFRQKLTSNGLTDNPKIRRFRCKNPDCLKSHSRDATTGNLLEVKTVEKEKIYNIDNTDANRANKTLNVTLKTKNRIEVLKIVQRESYDEVLNRIIDFYNSMKPQ